MSKHFLMNIVSAATNYLKSWCRNPFTTMWAVKPNNSFKMPNSNVTHSCSSSFWWAAVLVLYWCDLWWNFPLNTQFSSLKKSLESLHVASLRHALWLHLWEFLFPEKKLKQWAKTLCTVRGLHNSVCVCLYKNPFTLHIIWAIVKKYWLVQLRAGQYGGN